MPSHRHPRAVKLTHVAGAYWRGDERNPMLQRIYGTAFPIAEGARGAPQAPRGGEGRATTASSARSSTSSCSTSSRRRCRSSCRRARSSTTRMVQYMRGLYDARRLRGGHHPAGLRPEALPRRAATCGQLQREHVPARGPRTSSRTPRADEAEGASDGHAGRDEPSALKPMNCPSHCVIFGARRRSYRELPWRVADFGRLHRYERGGVVHGLARVRSFCQDDAHIFCARGAGRRRDRAASCGSSTASTRRSASTKIDIKLATRPDKRIGTDEEWDRAEAALAEGARRRTALQFELVAGRGRVLRAEVSSSTSRTRSSASWQLGTLQFDHEPARALRARATRARTARTHRPVMLHRAVFGSLERFFAVYLEHCGRQLPGLARARAGRSSSR